MAEPGADEIEQHCQPDEGEHDCIGAREGFVKEKDAAEELQGRIDIHEDARQGVACGLDAFGEDDQRCAGDDACCR